MIKIGKNQFLLSQSNKNIICESSIPFAGMVLSIGTHSSFIYKNNNNYEVAVIGYAIDCRDPQKNTSDFACMILDKISNGELFKDDFLDYWGGRYSVIISVNNRFICFGDSCGLKQTYFINVSNEIGLASQVRFLAAIFDLEPDDAAEDYIRRAKELDKEYSWPLFGTRYNEIERILPNHYYDSGKHGQERMAFVEISRDNQKNISLVSSYLSNQMIHVSKNYHCAVTLTAGLDSRIVFAHSVDCDDIEYVTLKYIGVLDDAEDIVVPQLLCKQYKKQHTIIPCDGVNQSFIDMYKEHSEDPHEYWIQMNYGIYNHKFDDYLWIKGSCNEIMQYCNGVLPPRSINSKVICKLFGLPFCDYSKRIINKWLDETRNFADNNKIDLLNLFYWEHRMGSWLSACFNEQDCIGDCFSPFNVRKILLIMNSFPRKSRIAPNYDVYREMIKYISDDLLDMPINRGRYNTVKSKIRCFIKYRCPTVYAALVAGS